MTPEGMRLAIEAQFVMRHEVGAYHTSLDRTTIENYSWTADQVRVALHVPLNDLWDARLFELECQGLAFFSMDAPPVYWDEEGTEHLIDGWEDQPREHFGSLGLYAAGVLRMADLYHRPYVTCHQSNAPVRHWELVREEIAARLQAPHDEEKWEREFPERALAMKAWQAQYDLDHPRLEEL
jgi:hypothetical protein